MWICPGCGEHIDDIFDACWKCGTEPDGTARTDSHAERTDADVLGSAPEPEAANQIVEPSDGAPADARNERIVELCSATDVVAAYALRDLLGEAGIPSRVVGEALGNAAGALPLGETLAPRIWVREQDVARAREIVARQRELGLPANREEQSEVDADSEDESVPVRFRWVSQGLVVVGVACISLGAVWAGNAWMTIRQYAATTEGVAVAYRECSSFYSPPPPEIPFTPEPPTFSFWYEVQYAFRVNGMTYYAVAPHSPEVVPHMTIHYDPHHPEHNVVGPLTRPWLVLTVTLGIGALMLFAGYKWSRNEDMPQAPATRLKG